MKKSNSEVSVNFVISKFKMGQKYFTNCLVILLLTLIEFDFDIIQIFRSIHFLYTFFKINCIRKNFNIGNYLYYVVIPDTFLITLAKHTHDLDFM